MGGKKTMYLHLGSPKTGSKSIQSFFYFNRWDLLKRHGVYYPFAGCVYENGYIVQRQSELFSKRTLRQNGGWYGYLQTDNPTEKFPSRMWAQLREEADRYPSADVLVSQELMGNFGRYELKGGWANFLREKFSDYSIKIIYYVRRLDEFAKSVFSQRTKALVKADFFLKDLDYSEFLLNSPNIQNSVSFFQMLMSEFSQDELVFRAFSSDKKIDTLKETLRIVGIDPSLYECGTRLNERFTNNESFPILQKIRDVYWEDTSWSYFKRLNHVMKEAQREKYNRITPAADRSLRKIDEQWRTLIPGYGDLFSQDDFSLDYPEIEMDLSETFRLELLLDDARRRDEKAFCSLHNSIVQAQGDNSEPLYFPVPWNDEGKLALHKSDSGALCFTRNAGKAKADARRVFATSVQDVELFILGSILDELGFVDSGVMSYAYCIRDYRGQPFETKVQRAGKKIELPYKEQSLLVLPGQYLLGHLSTEIMRNAIGTAKPLLVVRRVQDALYAYWHFERLKKDPGAELRAMTKKELVFFLQNYPGFCTQVFESAAIYPHATVVRFEDLISDNSEQRRPSVDALAEATGFAAEAIDAAIRGSRKSPAMHYVFSPDFGDIWDEEVEFYFDGFGYHELNEKLGYPRS